VSTAKLTSATDARYGVPLWRWADLDLVDGRGQAAHHVIPSGDGTGALIDVLVRPGTGNVLVVVLHGALDRDKYRPPRFEWHATLQNRSEHLMFVADPGIDMAPDLAIAWYTGTEGDDVQARIADLAQRVAVQLGASRIAFVGGSGGGFAAMMISHLVPESVALAFSPQTSIAAYYPRFVRRYREVVLPQFASMEEAGRAMQGRLSALDVYTESARLTNRVVLVQNTGDEFHMTNHLRPFLKQLGLPMETGTYVGGKVDLHLRYFSAGHGMPYKDILTEYLDETLARSAAR
jgi:pimeloyl-ACP methyl ester carboxylesterase